MKIPIGKFLGKAVKWLGPKVIEIVIKELREELNKRSGDNNEDDKVPEGS